MFTYKIDVIEELKKVGVNATVAKDSKAFSQSTMKKFKEGDTSISLDTLNRLCTMLRKTPNEIIDYEYSDGDSRFVIEVKR